MTLDGGNGAIIPGQKNIRLSVGTIFTEKLTATRTADGTGFWVICHEFGNNNFQVYKIDADGLDINPQIIPVGSSHSGDPGNSIGYLKVSPDGSRLACAIALIPGIVELFDFDPASGNIELVQSIINDNSPYGLEFSPNSDFLYISSFQLGVGIVSQLDIINNQISVVHTEPSPPFLGALQIGPDQKIYMAKDNALFLSTIESPDLAFPDCNFQFESTPLINPVILGLPTFIQSFFYVGGFTFENTCLGQATQFTLTNPDDAVSVSWDFGDGSTSSQLNPLHTYAAAGNFVVQLVVTATDGNDYNYDETVSISAGPSFTITPQGIPCVGNDIELLVPTGYESYNWSTGSTTNTTTVTSSGTYSCTVTDESGCQTTEEYELVMNPLPNVLFPDPSAVCVNETAIELTGGSPAGGTYSGDNVSGGNFDANAAGVGIHEILYTYTDPLGCSNTASAFIEVTSDIEVSLSVFTDVCENTQPFPLSGGTPSGGDYSGTGVVDNNFDPSSVGAGVYTITYTYSEGACGGSDSKDIIVLAKPTVELSFVVDSYCEDAEAITLNGGTPAEGNYLLGGSVVSDFDPQAEGPGNYEIEYSFVDGEGCSDTASAFIEVNALPVVTFGAIPALCQNTGIVTIDQGQPTGGGGIGAYSGSPNIDAAGNFNTTTAAGVYDLVYTYTDINGCADFAEQSVEIILEPQAPTAISVDNNAFCTAQAPTTISLECIGPDANYFWYENDFSGLSLGNTKTLTIAAPAITTTYLARSETSCGNSDALSITVTVNPSPTAAFSAADVCEDVAVNFLDESLSPLEPITSWNWDFGDGNTSTEESPTHIYSGFGNRDIQLIVKTDALCADTATQSISITRAPQPPTAISVNTDEYCISLTPEDITLECVGPDEDYYWYENDFTGTSIGTTKTLTIAAPAATTTYLARSETSCGNSYALSITVTVLPNPTAAFNAANVCDGNNVEFNDASFDNNDVITNWNWNFGDGNTSTDQNPSFLFSSYGTQDIELVVTNASGCVDTSQQSVEVFDNPVAAFDFSTECLGDASSFTNTSAAPASDIDSWTWEMEGSSYNTQNTTHTFSGSGDFVVNLTVETEEGCSNSISQTVGSLSPPCGRIQLFQSLPLQCGGTDQ